MKSFAICFVLLLFVSTNSYGQEDEELVAKKFEDVEWYQQVYWKMHVTRWDSASLVLKNHLVPATKAAGYDVNIFQFASGDWHFMAQFKLEGPDDLAWEVSPFSVELMKQLKEQEGGEKALPYWGASIVETKSEIIMKRNW